MNFKKKIIKHKFKFLYLFFFITFLLCIIYRYNFLIPKQVISKEDLRKSRIDQINNLNNTNKLLQSQKDIVDNNLKKIEQNIVAQSKNENFRGSEKEEIIKKDFYKNHNHKKRINRQLVQANRVIKRLNKNNK